MENTLNNASRAEKAHLVTNIVGETKKMIMEEPEDTKHTDSQPVTDEEVKKAVERMNPDPNSLKSRG